MDQMSVVLAKYPFSNQIDYKIRPAVILSNENFNKKHNYFLVCPITSKKRLMEYQLKIHENDFSGKLKKESFVRADFVASMEKELMLKEIGKISPEFFLNIKNKILENMQ